jgi:hypothetical protein
MSKLPPEGHDSQSATDPTEGRLMDGRRYDPNSLTTVRVIDGRAHCDA